MSFGSWFKHTFVGDDATHDAQGNPTEADPSGGLGDGQHGHQGAARGSPRAGVAPSVSSYQLNGDPDYLRQIQQQASALGVDAGNNGNYFNQNAQDISGQANGLAQSGQGLAAQAAQMGQAQNDFFGEQAGNVRSRQAPTTTYGQQLGQQQNLSAAANAAQMGLAQQLQGYAAQPEGPSAAQAQLQQGTNQALASQLALARSGRGLGESATGLSQAGEQASGIVANQANQSAALRAQETQAYRQNQLNALGASGQALGAAQSGSLGLAGQTRSSGSSTRRRRSSSSKRTTRWRRISTATGCRVSSSACRANSSASRPRIRASLSSSPLNSSVLAPRARHWRSAPPRWG
jgi:hypothetical protein